MQEFLILIHRDLTSEKPLPSPEQMQMALKPYQEWIAGIGAQDKLVALPKRWDLQGRIISLAQSKKQVVTGPFTESKASVGGVVLIKADDYDEAVKIAEKCPIIEYGAIVEVRMAIPMS